MVDNVVVVAHYVVAAHVVVAVAVEEVACWVCQTPRRQNLEREMSENVKQKHQFLKIGLSLL